MRVFLRTLHEKEEILINSIMLMEAGLPETDRQSDLPFYNLSIFNLKRNRIGYGHVSGTIQSVNVHFKMMSRSTAS